MSYRLYNETYVSNIADAIRNKNGASSTYYLSDMAKAITDIPTGGTRPDQDIEDFLLMGVARSNFFSGEYSDSEVTTVGSSVFSQCPLTSVNFPVCTKIGKFAFSNCPSLKSISFPACTMIDMCAFQYCKSLTSINFPECITIGQGAFTYCSSLTSASFPKCTMISTTVFQNCSSLASISFPQCTTLYSEAFRNCSSLTTVSFPKCTVISGYVFYGCRSLKSVYIGTSNCVLGTSWAFYSTSTDLKIYVHSAYADAYRSSTNWNYFSNRIVGY